MRKQWLGICITAGIPAVRTGNDSQQRTVSMPQPAVCNDPIIEISGVSPRFKPLNTTANQDYQRDGKSYKTMQDPPRFGQVRSATVYDAEPGSNLTISGEAFDPIQLTVAHPTLPASSCTGITNLANGRVTVVRINGRNPYGNDHVIPLSRAVAGRFNMSDNTKVRTGPIIAAQDGSLSGPDMACTIVAKQTYALLAPSDLSGGVGIGLMPVPQGGILPVSNSTLKNEDPADAPITSSDFPDILMTLAPGALEDSELTPVSQPVITVPSIASATSSVMVISQIVSRSANDNFMMQVGAVSDQVHT